MVSLIVAYVAGALVSRWAWNWASKERVKAPASTDVQDAQNEPEVWDEVSDDAVSKGGAGIENVE